MTTYLRLSYRFPPNSGPPHQDLSTCACRSPHADPAGQSLVARPATNSPSNGKAIRVEIRRFGPKGRPPPAQGTAQKVLASQKKRDTAPELALRRVLFARGLRYRVDASILPGLRRRADVVFPRERVAVFMDGCFWHACPQHGNAPKTNSAWWAEKLAANAARDQHTDMLLQEAGWRVLRFWEHEEPSAAAERVLRLLLERRALLPRPSDVPR